MYKRDISEYLNNSLNSYSVLTLLGPRQSGKTTLVRNQFPQFEYRSLEDPDVRAIALEDPRGFLNGVGDNVILDEFQRVPELSSYVQGIVDGPGNKRKFILTGSNDLMLMDSITQTLAGRTELFELLPLSFNEISKFTPEIQLNDLLFNGGYPRIYNEELDPIRWHKSYFQLYVEKDIRQITNIKNIDLFEKFVKLTAGRIGQLVNASSLSNEVGVTSPTISEWLAALRSTYICFTLKPHHRNFNKKIVKGPKIYFYDTGLLCYLLGINSKEQLNIHPLRGNIFENFIVSEYFKISLNAGKDPSIYFWRDQKGHEVDLILEKLNRLYPIEIKMSETFNSALLKNINYLNKIQEKDDVDDNGTLIYCGDSDYKVNGINIVNWKKVLIA